MAEEQVEEKPTKQKQRIKDVIEKLKAENTFFKEEETSEPYVAINGSGALTLPLRSQDFKVFLVGYAMDALKSDEPINSRQVEDIVNVLSAFAIYRSGNTKRLDVRLRQTDTKEIWIDRGSSAIRVTSEGWDDVENPPILFRRYKVQKPIVKPQRGGDLEALRQFINIKDESDWLVFSVFVVSTLFPSIPKPAAIIAGDQGSGKSFGSKIVKRLVDNSRLSSTPIIKSEDDLARVADRNIVLVLDNLDRLTKKEQNELCRLVTGSAFIKRTPYTDGDDTVYETQLQIIMNGLDVMVANADALDRMLIIRTQRIANDKRLTEAELNMAFDNVSGLLLGAILDILVKTLKIYNPCARLGWTSRMSDWTVFGWACGEAMLGEGGGDKFIEAYKRIIDRTTEEALKANSVALAAQYLVRDCAEWVGTATEFYDRFTNKYHDIDDIDIKFLHKNKRRWPGDPAVLGKVLAGAKTTLESLGIEYDSGWGNKGRRITLTNTKLKEEPKESVGAVGAVDTTEIKKTDELTDEDLAALEEIPFY